GNPVDARLDELDGARLAEVALGLLDAGPDPIARQPAGHEDDIAVRTSHATPAVRERLDLQQELLAASRPRGPLCRRRGHPSYRCSPLAFDLGPYRRRAERFCEELSREYYRHLAGHKPDLAIEPIYEAYADLFERDAVGRLRELNAAAG